MRYAYLDSKATRCFILPRMSKIDEQKKDREPLVYCHSHRMVIEFTVLRLEFIEFIIYFFYRPVSVNLLRPTR